MSSRVPISSETLNKDNCHNICDFLEQLSVKTKESGVNVAQEDHSIEESQVSDSSLKKSEMSAMAGNRVNV